MKKCIFSLLFVMSASIHAIPFEQTREEKLIKQRETILLLLQDDHQENLSMLPHDVRRHIASFMVYAEPWSIIQTTTKK